MLRLLCDCSTYQGTGVVGGEHVHFCLRFTMNCVHGGWYTPTLGVWFLNDVRRGRVSHTTHRLQFNWLTPRSRFLLQKLIVTQLVKKWAAFYASGRFITVVPILSQMHPLHTLPPCFPNIPIIILSSRLRFYLLNGLFPSRFPTKKLYGFLTSPMRAKFPAHLILLLSVYRPKLSYGSVNSHRAHSSATVYRNCVLYWRYKLNNEIPFIIIVDCTLKYKVNLAFGAQECFICFQLSLQAKTYIGDRKRYSPTQA